MEHVVFYPAPDGTPSFRRVAGLEDAVRLVEHLRNVEGVPEVHVHPLGDEVPLAFRTWYRVEVPGGAPAEPPADQPGEASRAAVPVPSVEPAPEPVAVVEPVVEPVAVVEPAPEAEAESPVESVEPVMEVPTQVPPLEAVGAEPTENGHRDTVKSLGFFAT